MQSKAQESSNTIPLSTPKDIAQAMKQAGFQIDSPKMLQIIGDYLGREPLKEMLRGLLNKDQAFEKEGRHLLRLTECLKQETQIRANDIVGYQIGTPVLLRLSEMDEADAIIASLSEANDSRARDFIRRTIAVIENEVMSNNLGFDLQFQTETNQVSRSATDAKVPKSGVDMSNEGYPSEPSQERVAQAVFKTQHVYGGSGALCFSTTMAPQNKYHTLRVEAAPTSGQRSYDWSRKVSIQFSNTELTDLFAVFQGWRSELKITGHGESNNKSATFRLQEAKGLISYYANIHQKNGQSLSVPIPLPFAYEISTLILQQMQKNAPHMTPDMIYQMVMRMYAVSVMPEQRD